MTRVISKLMTAGLTVILLTGLAAPALAQADTTTDTVTTTKQAKSESAIKISAVETPYAYFSTTSGIKRLSTLTGWPESLTVDQLKDDDYMQKLQASHPIDDTLNLNDIRDGMLTMAESVSSFDLQKSFLANLLDAENIAVSDTEYVDTLTTGTLMDLWMTKMVMITRQTGTIDQAAMAQDYAENMIPELKRLNLSETIINAYNPAIFSAKDFETHIWLVFQQKYDQLITQLPALAELSSAEAHKIDPVESVAEQKRLLLAPMSDYLTKLRDGSYRLSGSVLNMFIFISTGLPPEVTPTPTPTPTPAKAQPVTVRYVDEQGKTLAPDQLLTGELGASYHSDALDIPNYTLTKTPANATGTFTSDAQTVTYVYAKPALQTGSAAATVDPVAPKGTVIYATKKIGLYRTATFSKKQVKRWYAKKSRTNRPMFVVTGYAKSKNGVKRYHVKDVNHHSKTAGKTGYVTTKRAYTAPVYYAKKHAKITVINPAGVNGYAKQNLTQKRAHYRQGQVLKVKRIVRHNLTTRFVLTNGRYVTANKQLVQAGKVQMPKRIKTKHAINRYTTANLTRKNRHIANHTTLKVTGWAYSNANNFNKRDTLRYHVAGGYITANKHLVRVVK
ncbi:MAG: DUF5776 domain-containing protein [Levilactobacillus sp.]|uniref:DUF5776 domain-containing protein n=1 Tax=Levilactobacillus sp. TaxID=2767919 RepID=UPI00258BEDF6|nr:DUF5776 domain-containing protein [Levilactobacillus sp.]MCI1552979.1 DUF5776 domain-containing protein [Levilactobacillus sp.]MCI1598120.1 DUF5776 domain-containing protein [Levilactobacillus sp.]MCI1605551.1 DUF5776 domain-containing protein [Levilactobacillus sp.]